MGGQLRSAKEGADTIVWLAAATAAGNINGRLLLDRRVRPFDRVPSTRLSAGDRIRLWKQVLTITGEPDPTA